ncbi:hypothetical protein Gotur_019380 [Gossypium turneri]
MKKEMISMVAKLVFLWMTWIFQLHSIFLLLHLLMLPLYWRKTYGLLALKSVGVFSPKC